MYLCLRYFLKNGKRSDSLSKQIWSPANPKMFCVFFGCKVPENNTQMPKMSFSLVFPLGKDKPFLWNNHFLRFIMLFVMFGWHWSRGNEEADFSTSSMSFCYPAIISPWERAIVLLQFCFYFLLEKNMCIWKTPLCSRMSLLLV